MEKLNNGNIEIRKNEIVSFKKPKKVKEIIKKNTNIDLSSGSWINLIDIWVWEKNKNKKGEII